MSMWSRLRSWAGGYSRTPTINVPGVQGQTIVLNLPDHSNVFALTTSEEGVNIGDLLAADNTRNRKVWLYMKPTVDTNGYVTLVNTDNASVAGEMDLGGSDITLEESDAVCLLLRDNGTWLKLRVTDNSP